MLPLRREEKEGCVRREKEGLKEELRETRVLVRGTLHECGGRWDRAKGVDEPSQLLRKTLLSTTMAKVLRESVAFNWALQNRKLGGCQNTAVHHLKLWFCKISVRSNCMCAQRWGLLKQMRKTPL